MKQLGAEFGDVDMHKLPIDPEKLPIRSGYTGAFFLLMLR